MFSRWKPRAKETLALKEAMDDDNRSLENKTKNVPKSETHVFEMPNIENGVTDIGDLWDCRNSQPLRHNLLNTSEFTSEILHVSPINKCDTKFRQIKSHEDKLKSLHIDAKMSLDFLLGKIKFEGQFEYDNSTSSKRSVDGILYNYLNEQYRVQLMPRIKPALLNRDVENMLQKGVIKATHVVGGVIIGAEVTAWIEVSDTISEEGVKMNGRASSGVTEGVLKYLSSLSGSAGVTNSDVQNTSNDEVSVSVAARPAMEPSPRSLEEFLPFIKNLPNDLKKHLHKYSTKEAKIFGVPIRFILYPISHYVDLEMETLYQELTDACQKDFVSVIAKCNDMQQAGYIWQIILERNQQLHFLQDSKSEFFQKVDSFEKEIREYARDVLSRSRKALSVFKRGESDMDEIETIVREFKRNDASSAEEKAIQMADDGTKELQRAYFDSTAEDFQSRVKRFTDRNECDIWLGKANPRLLLEIKPPCSEAIVKSFLDAAEHLISLEVDVAIAMPSISEGARLTLKCNEQSDKLEGPVLSKALGVLNAAVAEGYSSIHIFHKVLGSLCSTRIPLCKSDAGYLDKVLQMLLSETYGQTRERDVSFVRSLCDLSTELARSLDRVVICLPLGAPDTDLAVVRQFRSLAKQDAFSNLKWIFCNFEVQTIHEAPMLLIFLQSEIVAVCLDNLDIIILMDIMNSNCVERKSNFDTLKLTPTRFANTLHPERAHYTLEIMSRINSGIRISRSMISGFQDELHEELDHLMLVIRATLQNDNAHLASAVAALVTNTFKSLSPTLRKNGLHAVNEKIGSGHFELVDCACKELVSELEKWMSNRSLEAIVQETQQKLLDLHGDLGGDSVRRFNEALKRIMDHDHCPKVVGSQISKLISSRETLKAKCTEVSNTLNIDLLKDTVEVGYSHIRALITVLQKSSQRDLSPETIAGELVQLYSRRSTAVTENAMIEDELTRFLTPYQPYHMLNTLHPLKHGQAAMRLYKALEDLHSLDNSDAVAEIISIPWDVHVLNQTNSEMLWKNEQWLSLVRHCLMNHNTRKHNDSLFKWMAENSNSSLIPANIVQMFQQYNTEKEIVSGKRIAKMSEDIIGHEYCFQSCGEMYHIALGENMKVTDLRGKLIQPFAEYLIAGKVIELINGDSGEIPMAFFRSICRTVSPKIRKDKLRPTYKPMRVFVMTLFEPRMSQRSSLLSSFFSCKYASSVERHNKRGLFMRMIVLDKSVRTAYGYDAILVLNTESLRSQEVITNYNKDHYDAFRDWLSTIFAISLSNLTVIDEDLCNEQRDGFERVLEVLARLKGVNIDPDILVSRVFSDKTSSTEGGSLTKIVDKIIRKHLDGVNSNSDARVDYAHQLKNKLDSGIIYLNVPYLGHIADEILNEQSCEAMHENVSNLCVSLLSRDKSRGHKTTFDYWFELLQNSWNCLNSPWHCVKRPPYWLQLREAKEFHELAYFAKQVANAKELLTRAFLFHRNKFLEQISQESLKGISATEICQQLDTIPSHCRKNCKFCEKSVKYREKLYLAVKDTAWQDIIRITIQNHRKLLFESIKNLLKMDIKERLRRQNIAQNLSKQMIDALQKIHEDCPQGIFTHFETSVHVEEIWTQLLTTSAKDENEASEGEQFALIVNELFPKWENSGFTCDLLLACLKNFRSVDATDVDEADLIPESLVKDYIGPLTVPKMIQILAECQDIASKLQAQTVPFHKTSFNNLHVFKLSSEINRIMSEFLVAKRFDYYQAGIKFETVMLREFNEHILAILTKFEKKIQTAITK